MIKPALRTILFIVFTCAALKLAFAQDIDGAVTPQTVKGEWTVSDKNPKGNCMISLQTSNDVRGYKALAYGCMDDDMQGLAGWQLRSTAIILTDAKGAVLASLKMMAPSKYAGLNRSGAHLEMTR